MEKRPEYQKHSNIKQNLEPLGQKEVDEAGYLFRLLYLPKNKW